MASDVVLVIIVGITAVHVAVAAMSYELIRAQARNITAVSSDTDITET